MSFIWLEWALRNEISRARNNKAPTSLTNLVTPNATTTRDEHVAVMLGWGIGLFVLWQFVGLPFLPKPTEILTAFNVLRQDGTFLEFGISIWTMFESIICTLIISLGLAYASTMEAIEPLAAFIGKWRYLPLVGLMLFFNLLAPDGHTLKVMLLTFGMTVFYLPDMTAVVRNIPKEEFDHARTLGMSPLRVTWEVVVLGTLDSALESLRNNAAMGWSMLTMVEGVVRSEGGIGVVLLNMRQHMDLPALFAIMCTLFAIGWAQDRGIGFLKDFVVAPWAKLGKGT